MLADGVFPTCDFEGRPLGALHSKFKGKISGLVFKNSFWLTLSHPSHFPKPPLRHPLRHPSRVVPQQCLRRQSSSCGAPWGLEMAERSLWSSDTLGLWYLHLPSVFCKSSEMFMPALKDARPCQEILFLFTQTVLLLVSVSLMISDHKPTYHYTQVDTDHPQIPKTFPWECIGQSLQAGIIKDISAKEGCKCIITCFRKYVWKHFENTLWTTQLGCTEGS